MPVDQQAGSKGKLHFRHAACIVFAECPLCEGVVPILAFSTSRALLSTILACVAGHLNQAEVDPEHSSGVRSPGSLVSASYETHVGAAV